MSLPEIRFGSDGAVLVLSPGNEVPVEAGVLADYRDAYQWLPGRAWIEDPPRTFTGLHNGKRMVVTFNDPIVLHRIVPTEDGRGLHFRWYDA